MHGQQATSGQNLPSPVFGDFVTQSSHEVCELMTKSKATETGNSRNAILCTLMSLTEGVQSSNLLPMSQNYDSDVVLYVYAIYFSQP